MITARADGRAVGEQAPPRCLPTESAAVAGSRRAPRAVCQRCGQSPLPRGRTVFCSRACRRRLRPICARPGCRQRCRKLEARYCSKSCTALARGRAFDAVRRRAGRTAWLRHGLPAYLARLAQLDQHPDVRSARDKAEAYARGITRGTVTVWQAVRRFYARQGWPIPPGLRDQMERSGRRQALVNGRAP